MPGAGIEPATQSSSGFCSTTELLRLLNTGIIKNISIQDILLQEDYIQDDILSQEDCIDIAIANDINSLVVLNPYNPYL